VLDYNANDGWSFLVNSYGGGGSHVSLYQISDAGSSPGLLVSADVNVPGYSVAPPAAQHNSSVVVDTGNASITQAVNNVYGMYATLTTGYNGAAAIMWLRFNPFTQVYVNSGILYYPGLAFFNSSISKGSSGTSMYTYALSGSSIYPSSAVVGMDVNDSLTTNEYVHQGAYATPQTGSMTCSGHRCSRWGDFTSTYTDPVNSNYFWSASQDMANSSNWGTVIAYASA
jgi:hypothetical protein